MKFNFICNKITQKALLYHDRTFNVKKIVKRIAAMGAAVMMMSSMAIGASAASPQSFCFDIYYVPQAPSTAIKISQSGYFPKGVNVTSKKQAEIVYSNNVNNTDVKVVLSVNSLKYTRYYSKKKFGNYDVFSVTPGKRYKVKASLYNYTNKQTSSCRGWIQDY